MSVTKLCMVRKPFSSRVLITSGPRDIARLNIGLDDNKLIIRGADNFYCVVDGDEEILCSGYGNIGYFRQESRDPYKFFFKFDDGSKLYVDEFSYGYGSRWLYQDVEIKNHEGVLLGRVRYNNFCLIGSNKATMFCEDQLDINLSVAILGFFWLKKENSAHDSLG